MTSGPPTGSSHSVPEERSADEGGSAFTTAARRLVEYLPFIQSMEAGGNELGPGWTDYRFAGWEEPLLEKQQQGLMGASSSTLADAGSSSTVAGQRSSYLCPAHYREDGWRDDGVLDGRGGSNAAGGEAAEGHGTTWSSSKDPRDLDKELAQAAAALPAEEEQGAQTHEQVRPAPSPGMIAPRAVTQHYFSANLLSPHMKSKSHFPIDYVFFPQPLLAEIRAAVTFAGHPLPATKPNGTAVLLNQFRNLRGTATYWPRLLSLVNATRANEMFLETSRGSPAPSAKQQNTPSVESSDHGRRESTTDHGSAPPKIMGDGSERSTEVDGVAHDRWSSGGGSASPIMGDGSERSTEDGVAKWQLRQLEQKRAAGGVVPGAVEEVAAGEVSTNAPQENHVVHFRNPAWYRSFTDQFLLLRPVLGIKNDGAEKKLMPQFSLEGSLESAAVRKKMGRG